MKQYKARSQKTASKKRLWFIALGIILVAAIPIAALELTDRTYFFHNLDTTSNTTPDSPTKGEPEDEETEMSQSRPAETDESKQTNTANPNAPLRDPSGDFVSNHRAKKSDTISSVCTTTIGAKCQIIFTRDGNSKSLESAATDGTGTAYWNWKPSDIGLSLGTWEVTAKATLGSQTKTTEDVLTLEVSNE